MGEGMFFVAVAVLVIDLRGVGAEVGAVLAGASLLLALMLPLGGWLGDHFQAERLMFVTNLARAALMAVLAALVLAGDPPMAAIYVLVAAMGAVDGLHFPVRVLVRPPRGAPAGAARRELAHPGHRDGQRPGRAGRGRGGHRRAGPGRHLRRGRGVLGAGRAGAPAGRARRRTTDRPAPAAAPARTPRARWPSSRPACAWPGPSPPSAGR